MALVAVAAMTASAKEVHYRQINLVSDLPDVAILQDTNLINAWGISFSPTGPFWVSAADASRSVIYAVTNDATGAPHVTKNPLEVAMPGGENPTGQVFNNAGGFNGDIFLFVSEQGTIFGWRPPLGGSAEVLATRPTASYKGVTLASSTNGPVLLAANFAEGTVDVWGTNGVLITQLSDTNAPDDYSPFNVQLAGGQVFVTYAKREEGGDEEEAGRGKGLIDVLDVDSRVFHRFATGSDAGGHLHDINAPWGVAVAPESFGAHGGQVLIGNFGSGTIMAFDTDGKFRGLLRRFRGGPVVIDGLWALTFGNGGTAGVEGTLYFSAGPDEESHGLFGSLEPGKDKDHGNPHD
jgi:uncharacterized protein (TIGR03118 family)